jgi:hypothetical protein
MNVGADRQGKSSQGHGHGDVRRCYQGRVTQAKVLVTYMKRESDGGGHEAQSIPGLVHRIGRRPTGERSEGDAEDKVHRA